MPSARNRTLRYPDADMNDDNESMTQIKLKKKWKKKSFSLIFVIFAISSTLKMHGRLISHKVKETHSKDLNYKTDASDASI